MENSARDGERLFFIQILGTYWEEYASVRHSLSFFGTKNSVNDDSNAFTECWFQNMDHYIVYFGKLSSFLWIWIVAIKMIFLEFVINYWS